MSVHKMSDGRWMCKFPRGKDPDRPRCTVKYFGIGPQGAKAAVAFHVAIGLGEVEIPSEPEHYPELQPLPESVLVAARLRRMAQDLILEAERLEADAGMYKYQPKRHVEHIRGNWPHKAKAKGGKNKQPDPFGTGLCH